MAHQYSGLPYVGWKYESFLEKHKCIPLQRKKNHKKDHSQENKKLPLKDKTLKESFLLEYI